MHDIGTLWDGGSSYAYDINNSGKVVGSSQGHGFIYDSTNGMKDLNDLVPAWNYPDYPIEGATAINSDGQIAVYVPWLGFLLKPATTATPATYEVQYFPTLGNNYGYDYGYPSAADINDSGKAVGAEVWNWNEGGSAPDWNGFLYDSESATPQMQDLGRYSSPTDINSAGKVLMGSALYDSATQKMQNLGTVGDYYSSRPRGINDWEQVVGSACKTFHYEGVYGSYYYDSCHAFLKESGQPMIDLNTLLPADSDGSFGVSGSAEAASSVELFEGTTSKGTTKADSSTEAWSIPLSEVSESAHTYYAKAKDAACNTSSASSPVTVTMDKTAPTVSSVSPPSGATGVSLSTSVTASFSEEMDPATLTTSTFTLTKQGSTTPMTSTVSYDAKTATLKPSSTLAANTKYTAAVKGGASGAKDKAGNALASNKMWSFTAKK